MSISIFTGQPSLSSGISFSQVRNFTTATILAIMITNVAFLLVQFLFETTLLVTMKADEKRRQPGRAKEEGVYEKIAGSGFLDFFWCCTIVFAVTSLDVTVFNLCSDPERSVRAPFACAAYKISTLPSAPFVICTGAAALVPLLSVATVPNVLAVLACFALTAGQWAAFYVTPPPPPGLPPGSFSSNVLRTGALIILLFLLNFVVLIALSILVPTQIRSSYALQMQAEQNLRRYAREAERSARLQVAAARAQLALVRVVSDSTIGFLGHSVSNPLHALSALLEEIEASAAAGRAWRQTRGPGQRLARRRQVAVTVDAHSLVSMRESIQQMASIIDQVRPCGYCVRRGGLQSPCVQAAHI